MLGLGLGGIALGRYIYRPPLTAARLVPQNPLFILETNNFWEDYQQLRTFPLGEALSQTPALQTGLERLDFLREVPKFSPDFRAFFRGKTCTASLHLSSREEVDWLWFVPVVGDQDKLLYNQILLFFKNQAEYRLQTRSFRGLAIQEIEARTSGLRFSFLRYGAFWVGSFNSILVEDVVRKIQERNWFSALWSPPPLPKDFEEWGPASGRRLWLNPKAFHSLWRLLAREGYLRNWPAWLGLRQPLSLGARMPLKSGILEGFLKPPPDTEVGLDQLFRGQSPPPFGLEAYLPRQTVLTLRLGFSENSLFFANLAAFAEQFGPGAIQKQAEWASRYGVALTALHRAVGPEMALTWVERQEETGLGQLLLLKLPSRGRPSAFPASDSAFQEKYAGFVIQKWPGRGLSAFLPGVLGAGFENCYWVSNQHIAVFGNSVAVLREWIQSQQQQKNWQNDLSRKAWLSQIPARSHLTWVLDPHRALPFMYENASEMGQTWLAMLQPLLEGLTTMVGSCRAEEAKVYTHVLLHSSRLQLAPRPQIEGYQVLMNRKLPQRIFSPPYLLQNHLDQSTEILVQDYANQLYLITEKGQVLWQRPGGAPLRSTPQQIDIYRNGKLQCLYLTADRIGLIDRLGRDVPKFPVYLPDTTHLETLAKPDFGDQQHYFLVSNRRGRLYMLDQARNRLPGWRPRQIPSRLGSPVQHLQLQSEDYLLAMAENGTLHVFDREGGYRAGFPLALPGRMRNPLWIKRGAKAGDTEMMALTEEGILMKINLLGETLSEMQLIRPSAKAQFLACPASDAQDWLAGVGDKNLVQIFDATGQLLFEQKFEQAPGPWAIQYFRFGNQHKLVACTDKTGGLTYLYDLRGRALGKPFPSQQPIALQFQPAAQKLKIYRVFGTEVGILELHLP
ncbi:MAG: hypothetical protein OHK0053_15410 [Microscillaceae bacterium]